MASSAVQPLRHRPPQRLALLALAVVSCLQLLLPAASQLSQPQPLPRPLARTATDAAAMAAPLEAAGEDRGLARRSCTYTVQIKTSCSSPRRSSDAVSLAFGDAYRDEVYAARLTPEYGFESCATDTFKVSGPCGYGVCYLYLRRTGRVGWTPEWVRVYEPTSSTPSTYRYGDPLPNGVWYGFNRCPHRAAAAKADADASSDAAAQAL
ncbi:embryo-specific protein ATS3A-like [Phragmites australis]|uniref:embryo-specific protein ATS3A-like n=1 Tax=Phragmites australis TaxID=29695 RepID=UPI002D77C6A8|nr:embryo-specific protein ATS3A-like [Phragmites australis]